MTSKGVSSSAVSVASLYGGDPVPNVEDVSQYKEWKQIGHGAFGAVFTAKDSDGKTVALKEIRAFDGPRFPDEILDEIRIHDRVPPGNVAVLIHICKKKRIAASINLLPTYYLVFEFGEHDFVDLLKNSNVVFTLGEIKEIMMQMFQGLETMHDYKVFHGNLNPSNVRMSMDGNLKIVKFEWTRFVYSNAGAEMGQSVEKHAGVWYRSPELLLDKNCCKKMVDSWSAGCIMAELFIREPLMQGRCVEEQLVIINKICGPITHGTFPGCQEIPLYKQLNLPMGHERQIKKILQNHVQDPKALDVISKLLTINPARRMDCPDALQHDFFTSDPLPRSLTSLMDRHLESKDLPHATIGLGATSLGSGSSSDRTGQNEKSQQS